MIIKRNYDKYRKSTALYVSAACIMLAVSVDAANSAEPFQILETDLSTAKQAAPTAPQPFQMLASDLASGVARDVARAKTIIYQGSDSAGDAEITNNTDESLYFNDQSTASSATIINNTGGETRFNDQSTAASAFMNNNADAQLSFNQNSTAADARITNNGNGNLVFNDNASAGSAVITNNGATAFNGHSSADNALITNNATGTIDFNDQSNAGRRNIYNSGQIHFADQSSAQNSLIDNNKTGSIQFSGNSTGAAANINNSGELGFTDNSNADETVIVNNKTGTVRFDGQAVGAGTTITNSGAVVFGGQSDAQGAVLTNNAEADLRFQNNASAGASKIVNAGDLTFSDNSSAGQSNIITSEGGTTRFQGNANGGTTTLQIDQNGSLDVSQMTEHRLSIGSLTSAGDVNLGRTVLNAQDKIVLNESSRLNLVLGYGQLIAHDVELQGGTLELQHAADLLYALGETYRIIDAQSFSGSNFATDIVHDFAFVNPLLNDNGTSITLERNTVLFASAAQTQNQTAVANALEGLAPDTLTYRTIISGSQSDAQHSFDQLSGEIHASVASAVHDNSNLLRMALLERARKSVLENRANNMSWQSWLTATGAVSKRNGNDNTAASRLSGYGVNGGFDTAVTDAFSLGFAGNYEQNTLKITDRTSTADIKTFGAGIYGAWADHGFGLRGGAAYQRHAIDVDRNLALPALTGNLQSDYSAWTGQIFAEAGYRFDMAGVSIEPFGGVSYVHSQFNGFQETGLTDAALSGSSTSFDSTNGTLGIRMNKRFMLNDALSVDASFEAAWNRAFGDQRSVRQVAFSSGLPFEITGTGLSRDYLLLDARLSFWRSERLGIDMIYSGLLSSDIKSHRFGTTATVRF